MSSISAKRLMLENGGRSLSTEMLKYKKHRVSAIRDFPPGCGPKALKADFRGNGAVCYSEYVQNTQHPVDECPEVENKKASSAAESPTLLNVVDKSDHLVQKASGLELVKDDHSFDYCHEVENITFSSAECPALSQGVDNSVQVMLRAIELELMKDEHSFDGLVDLSKSLEPNSMSGELLQRSYYSSETLQVDAESITKKVMHKTQELSIELVEKLKISGVLNENSTKISSQEEKMVAGPRHHLIPSAVVCKEGNYPPRRRVSAVRDFPPGCGTNMFVSKNQLQVQAPMFSEGQYRMTELQSSIGLQREKTKLAYDRKMEKGASEGKCRREAVVDRKDKGDKNRKRVYLGNTLQAKSMVLSDHAKFRVCQQGQMGAVNCPRQQGIATSSCVGAKDSRRGKGIIGKQLKLKSHVHEAIKDIQVWKDGVASGVAPFVASSDGAARNKVRETLRLFQAVTRKLLQEEETSPKEQRQFRRVDLLAAKILKDKGKYTNAGKPIIGLVPGVEVGDEFHYRVELMIIGLHRPPQGGIDSVKVGERALATSVVDSGGYDNKVDDYDVWTYTGQGGNVAIRDKQPEDQKLERGNLALKNSIQEKNAVRVIRGVKDTKHSEGRLKVSTTYTYYGLYTVERYWQETGPHGKKEYKFELRRLPGQRDPPWKELKKSKKFKLREGGCVSDISQGKEKFPIWAVNTIDGGKPPPFIYISRMIYPGCNPVPPQGCDCIDGCVNSIQCSCVVKNGGGIPFNFDGAIVEAKSLVYECGPSCKCPSSCYNRVSQHGIRFQLEIFKTERRGWGVRSLSSIPSGSFICEYTGELLAEKEAEQRSGYDEYLFDIGYNCNDHSLWKGLSGLIPDAASGSHEVVADSGFTIDAAKYGNVGRFINHSCSPNLYAQNVLYDHGDTRMPHIMLFAAENIPPLQELTYHYNYKLGQVYDKDGNIKVKYCYCGSSNCTGRMY